MKVKTRIRQAKARLLIRDHVPEMAVGRNKAPGVVLLLQRRQAGSVRNPQVCRSSDA